MGLFDFLFSDDDPSQRANQNQENAVLDINHENMMTVDPNKLLPEYSKELPPVVFGNG